MVLMTPLRAVLAALPKDLGLPDWGSSSPAAPTNGANGSQVSQGAAAQVGMWARTRAVVLCLCCACVILILQVMN